MNLEKIIKSLLMWLPSLVISVFFIHNAFNKIFYSNEMNKVISNKTILIITGIFLLISIALFLYNKTVLIGALFLAFYMMLIIGIHIYKGKPYEVAILIVMATIFAAYIRCPFTLKPKRSY